jgi:ribosomal-protein-alanine N-acetyltransferase
MPFPLQTARLSIRPLTGDDGADLHAVFAAPRVMRYWNSAPPADFAEACEWAARLADMQRRLGYSQWRVGDHAGGLIGIAGLQPLAGGPEVELIYALEPSAWGQGYATEAGAAALEYGFREAGLERIVAIAREANAASVNVLHKLGMRPLGVAEYWGTKWAKFGLSARTFFAERRAAALPLVTERLELRRFAAPDLEPLRDVFADPEVMRFVGPDRLPLSGSDLALSQANVETHWSDHGFGPLALVERSSGRVVGEVGLQLVEAGPDVELTATLARLVWGRGYATEAARAVLVWAFAGLRLQRVVAVADPANVASLRVLEKIGMVPVGLRDCYGSWLAEYALTLAEWRAPADPARPRL